MWACQLHIVKRGVQRTPGFMELLLPNLDVVEEQLALVKPLLAGTDFWYDRYSTSAIADSAPWLLPTNQTDATIVRKAQDKQLSSASRARRA